MYGSFIAVPFKLRAAKLKYPEYELTKDQQERFGVGVDQIIQIYLPDFAIKNPKLMFTLAIAAELGSTIVQKEVMAMELKKKSPKVQESAPPTVSPDVGDSSSPSQGPEPTASQGPITESQEFGAEFFQQHLAKEQEQ